MLLSWWIYDAKISRIKNVAVLLLLLDGVIKSLLSTLLKSKTGKNGESFCYIASSAAAAFGTRRATKSTNQLVLATERPAAKLAEY